MDNERQKIKGLKYVDLFGVRCPWNAEEQKYIGKFDPESTISLTYDTSYAYGPYCIQITGSASRFYVARGCGGTLTEALDSFLEECRKTLVDLTQKLLLLEQVTMRHDIMKLQPRLGPGHKKKQREEV